MQHYRTAMLRGTSNGYRNNMLKAWTHHAVLYPASHTVTLATMNAVGAIRNYSQTKQWQTSIKQR